ncbi:transposable element Tc1 transposase [Trichonephila clavipes]|nr:transposable element Tc1 transposase [Trichonephila clavipes]
MQHADPAFTIARHTCPLPGVIAWGAISFDSRTLSVVIKGHTYSTAARRRHSENLLLPFLLQYPDLIFLQDNASLHTARISMNCLTPCQTLPWPARSLSNRACLGYGGKADDRRYLPENTDDLTQQLRQNWQEIPQETPGFFITLCHTMWQPRLVVGQHLIELVNL